MTTRVQWRMRILAVGDQRVLNDAWIKTFDLDDYDGMGSITTTERAGEAYLLDSYMQVVQTWQSRSRLMPWRPDGGDNRPLMIFTILPEPVVLVDGGIQ